MLFRMIKGALVRQWSKMLLIALTIALGASLATSMINVMLDVGDKVNEELKAYGANIVVKPKASSLLSEIYDVEDEGTELQQAWLKEEELGNLKTIFWAFNIRDFAPFLNVSARIGEETVPVTGTWFNHHLSLPTGEELDAGVRSLRSWWDVPNEDWIDEQAPGAEREIMVGTALAERMGIREGDSLILTGTASEANVTVRAYSIRATAPTSRSGRLWTLHRSWRDWRARWPLSRSAPLRLRTMTWPGVLPRTQRRFPAPITIPGTVPLM